MSIYGKIKQINIITLHDELNSLTKEDAGLQSYVRTKHETANKQDRYIVKVHVEDPRFKQLSVVNIFLPKGLIDNNLLDIDTNINCTDTSCHLEIFGVEDWFDRAMNGSAQIHEERRKEFEK